MKLKVNPHMAEVKGKNLDYKQIQLIHAISEVVLSIIENTVIVKAKSKKKRKATKKARKSRGIGPRDNNDYFDASYGNG